MTRQARAPMLPRLRPALLAAALAALAAAPTTAHADAVHLGVRLLQASAPAAGPPPPTITDLTGAARAIELPELLALAARQSPALAAAEIDLELAAARIEELRGLDDWRIAAEITGRNVVSSFPLRGMRFTRTRTEVGASADLTRLLPTGGSFTLHAETSWSRTVDADTRTHDYTDVVTATWVQPLLQGRGRRVARAAQAQAALAADATELARRAAAIDVVRGVVAAYWDLVLAQRDLEIRHSSLVLAQERLRRTQAAIQGGGTAATEALAVEQVIATREEEILAAELTVLARSLALRRLVGLAIGPDQLALTTTTELGVPGHRWELPALLADAYRTSPELAILATRDRIATIDVEVTENGLLPSLDLALTFGPVGVDEDPVGALRSMATFDGVYAVGSLRVQHALGNHAARGAARAARARRQAIQVDATDLRAQIAQALAEAVVLAETAARRVEIAGRAIELAEKNITAEQSRFSLGKSTNFDVLLRQEELKEAQLRQARAIIEWHKSAAVIAAITGSLLEDYGITLPAR
jgi:outer membrane protein